MLILAAMWAGSWLSAWFTSMGVTLPAYIGAMIVAAVIRNVDDVTKLIGMSQRTIDDLGGTALSLFLVMALMTLKLWDLVGVAVPLAIMLVLQIAAIAVLASTIVYPAMGKDYEAAVMAGGFCGFMLGTTANAMANMEAHGRAVRTRAEGLPRGADGRRVLHRLHERDHHYVLSEPLRLIERCRPPYLF